MAHEIGNPLNALHIHLQLMEREVKKLKATDSDAPLDLADPDAAANHAASIRKLKPISRSPRAKSTGWTTSSANLQAIRPTRPSSSPFR